jgi:hypothetical protein
MARPGSPCSWLLPLVLAAAAARCGNAAAPAPAAAPVGAAPTAAAAAAVVHKEGSLLVQLDGEKLQIPYALDLPAGAAPPGRRSRPIAPPSRGRPRAGRPAASAPL